MTVRTRRMPTTRTLESQFPPTKGGASQRPASSSTKRATAKPSAKVLVESDQKQQVVRQRSTCVTEAPPAKKPRKAAAAATPPPVLPFLSETEIEKCTTTVLPPLTFSLDAGKQHLVDVDVRFDSLVKRIPMRVFEELNAPKELNLFKTLVTSILGQQVSWLAARAILYKFVRLWWADLPVTPDFTVLPREKLPFPTPLQVCEASVETLRSAGLSGQKVKYVKDIAQRCADGRLDVRRIIEMDEEQVLSELVQIKGVGVWTAQMLLIFALRRPNILPVGDLGVQRGVVLLWCADHNGPAIKSAKAKPATPEAEKVQEAVELAQEEQSSEIAVQTSPLPSITSDSTRSIPSIPSQASLSHAQLVSRKNGTKTKGKQYLTPQEMEALCETWQPYRSLASVIMWGLVDA